VYWNHPAVAGITLWGYVEGATWSEGTGLLNSSGTERSAMTWLKSYMESLPNLGYPFSNVGEPLLKYKIEAEDYTEQSGISVIASSEGGDAITGISDDDHCCYGNIDFGLGYANMDLRISSTYSLGKPQGAIEIRIDSINGDLIGTVELVGTGGLDKWETFSGPITGIAGVHTIFFVFKTSRINVNWFELKNGITGIRTQKFEPELKIYPNPVTSGKVTVESKTSEKINTIQVIDLQGRIVKTIEPNQYKTEIELSSLIKGMYYLRIQTEYSLLSKKIVIL